MKPNDPHKLFSDTPSKLHPGWVIAVLLVVVAWVGAFAIRGGGEKQLIEGWQDGIDAGIAQAKASDKPMVVLFTAGWCGPCRVFKSDVLQDERVQAKLADVFVSVQIDLTDRSSSNPAFATAQQYGVQSIPRLMVITPEGELLGIYSSDRSDWQPETFNTWLDGIAQGQLAAND